MLGFTKFDNRLLEAILAAKFTKRQLKILLLVLRYSAGYHKAYAALSRSDFEAAGVSRYCAAKELTRLVSKGVIDWDPGRNAIWINPEVRVWAVEKAVQKPGQMSGIAAKNSPKQQLDISQIGNIQIVKTSDSQSQNMPDKKVGNIQRKSVFIDVMGEYMRRVAPLNSQEAFILREVTETHPKPVIMEAIQKAAETFPEHTFGSFLKALDSINQQRSEGGFQRLRSRLEKYLHMIPRP